jgi:hypothetical protein
MRFFWTFLLALSILSVGLAQSSNPWQVVSPQQIFLPESSELLPYYPETYQTYALNADQLLPALKNAPLEFTAAANQPLTVMLPMPNGSFEAFGATESPVMKPQLAAKYPTLKTYSARSLTRPTVTARFGWTDFGFHATISENSRKIYVDPYADGQTTYYMSYYTDAYDLENLNLDFPEASCGWSPDATGIDLQEIGGHTHNHNEVVLANTSANTPVTLRVYDMALACTGEFSQAKGGTLNSVMSALTQAMNRLNQTTVPETSCKFELIPNNDLLIFLNPASDPYANANVGLDLLNQNTNVINSIINPNTYDVGHVFTGGCTDVGGVVGGTVCTPGKARGVTCHFSSSINFIVDEIMAHEVAHQYATSHSWSNCPGIMGQLASNTAYEPGSGSTIMSYSGSCGDQNVQFGSDIYYHGGSIEQFHNYSRVSIGSTCPTEVETTNHDPNLTLPYPENLFIPINTPFELTAVADDIDGEALTYCWEQVDLGPVANLGEPIGNGPSFRSFPPEENPTRTFPRPFALVNNAPEITEVLPTYSRDLTFRCTVRDNNPEAGGTVFEDIAFKATEQAGPFRVSYPNQSGITLTGGDLVEVTWDVANTDQAPVNCQSVNIRLSTDGGYTYPITLLTAAPNTGSAMVVVPNITENQARIRVEAAENIFFDISNQNFSIEEATEPGFTFAISSPIYQTVCIPDETEVTFQTDAILDYDQPIQLEVTDIPPFATATFDNDLLNPGETATLSVDLTEALDSEVISITVQAISGTDTVFTTSVFNMIYSDFAQLAMETPVDGTSGLGIAEADFTWSDLSFADSYDIQVSSSPAFAPDDIIDDGYELVNPAFTPSVVLDDNELFFWRIRARNECTLTDWLPARAFHTITLACNAFESVDLPVGISSSGTPTVASELVILEEGTITDVNVINMSGYHDGLGQIEFNLISPDDTRVKLFGNICGNVSPFNLDLDDESPLPIPCPPNSGQPYQPQESLSAFDGKNTSGVWRLQAKVTDNFGNGGLLETWGLEFCADFSPEAPYLVKNDTLLVQPGGLRLIQNDVLLSEDLDNTAEELTYTVVDPPQHGTLVWFNNDLPAGGNFRQISINAGNVWYVHSGDGSEYDDFTFVVEDGTGGWISITQFNIKMDAAAPIATEDIALDEQIRVFPNPTSGQVTLEMPASLNQDLRIQVFNLQGQALQFREAPSGQEQLELDLSNYPNGLYFLTITAGKETITKKITLQR